jgi:hypothetical protein
VVRDKIRRTEEELMEMGTMDNALLQGHSPGAEGRGRAREKRSRIGVSSTFETILFII